MISIKHRFSGATLCEFDVETVKEAVLLAIKKCSNLRYSDLRGSNLSHSDLRGSNLSGSNLSGSNIEGEKITINPLSIAGLRYWCLITDGFMRLGCKRFTHKEWADFNDKQISEMDSHALEFWTQWKEPLISMCAKHAGAA